MTYGGMTADPHKGDIRAALARMTARDADIHAVRHLRQTVVIQEAQALSRLPERQRAGQTLHGLNIAVKDNIDIADTPIQGGSRLFAGRIATRDAWIITRLRAAGALFPAVTSMCELAWGTTGENAVGPRTRNPLDTRLDPGGSSSGAAAAVSRGLTMAALGTDTACSIRFPAHCCGITGFKPTAKRWDMTGIMPLVPSLDHVGLLTRSARDARHLFHAIEHDARPSAPAPRTRRIGIRWEGFENCDVGILHVMGQLLSALRDEDVTIMDCTTTLHVRTLPVTIALFAETWQVWGAAAHKNPDALSPTLRERLLRKSSVSLSEIEDARREQAAISVEMDHVLSTCDLLLEPTAQVTALPPAAMTPEHPMLASRNCTLTNISGHPSISIPCAEDREGRPVGVLLSAQRGNDQALLEHAIWLEDLIDRQGLRRLFPARVIS
ncbi:amidase [Novacetimonas sp. GS1]